MYNGKTTIVWYSPRASLRAEMLYEAVQSSIQKASMKKWDRKDLDHLRSQKEAWLASTKQGILLGCRVTINVDVNVDDVNIDVAVDVLRLRLRWEPFSSNWPKCLQDNFTMQRQCAHINDIFRKAKRWSSLWTQALKELKHYLNSCTIWKVLRRLKNDAMKSVSIRESKPGKVKDVLNSKAIWSLKKRLQLVHWLQPSRAPTLPSESALAQDQHASTKPILLTKSATL